MGDIISLAMPTYNGEKYLREQLNSIYTQTRVPDEVIVVDDCSSDDTVEILKEYHKKYGLKFYVNEHNLGYNKNFEKAISLCSGDYICLSDQDDVWLPEKIEKSYKKIKEFPTDKPALVSSFGYTTDANLNIKHSSKGVSGGWELNFLRFSSQGCTLMFNKTLQKLVLPIHPDIIYDAYIGWMAALTGNRYYIGENLMYYRIHGGNSLVHKGRSRIESIKEEMKECLPYWFHYERYKNLLVMKTAVKNKILPERLTFLNDILYLYECGKVKRLFKFLNLRGIPLRIKFKTATFLLIKILLFVPDSYKL